jgi:hypothetical protein
MLPVISLVKPIIAAIAPSFLKNLLGGDRSEKFAMKVLEYINAKVSPVNPNGDLAVAEAEVDQAIQKLQADPALTQNMLEMLLDSEREINEREIADLKDARQFRKDYGDEVQSNKLINISSSLLVFIIVVILAMLVVTPFLIDDVPPNSPTRDLVIQLSGAAFGFLTGIGGMFARNIGSAFDFWFGSSRGSKDKSDQIKTVLKNVQPQGDGTLSGYQPTGAPEPVDSIAKHRENFRQAMASA